MNQFDGAVLAKTAKRVDIFWVSKYFINVTFFATVFDKLGVFCKTNLGFEFDVAKDGTAATDQSSEGAGLVNSLGSFHEDVEIDGNGFIAGFGGVWECPAGE